MWRVEEVVDVAKKASQPGWDYVIDTGFDPSKAPITPANKKRTARTIGGDYTARQDAAILKRLADLEKDNARDVQIPIPARQKDNAGRAKGKTAATRKILMAQKTFTNYLADEEALAALEPQNALAARSKSGPLVSRPLLEQIPKTFMTDTPMPDADEDPSTQKPHQPSLRPASDGVDDSHLLESVVPEVPPEALMEALVSAPPLSYNAARVGPSTSGKPKLHFCVMCGYWGNYKCWLCGSRYCDLACKTKHDVDCQKYGAR